MKWRRFSLIFLDDQAGNERNPLSVAGNTGESGWQTSGASGGGTETDNADLIVYAVVVEAQWATRVSLNNQIKSIFSLWEGNWKIIYNNYVAWSVSASSVDTDDVISDDVTISGSAFSSGNGRSSHFIEGWRNGLESSIGRFTPSADQESISNVIGFTDRWHAERRDFSCST